jgi:3-hydroxybutyryl-CoA dehydrogenase
VSQPALTEQLGIAGSGQIACGLAKVAGTGMLWARSEESASRAREKLDDSFTVVTELAELAGCTMVIEAVAEDTQIKNDVSRVLDDVLADDAIIATTTSSLSIQELAEGSGRPDRFAGLHVFNPVPKMDLVEFAYPREARDETKRRVRALCEALGKTVVEVPDVPGFVVNRLLFPYLFNAVRLLDDNGLDAKAVDTCMQLGAAHPMGPLALLDFVGLDVAAAIGEAIGEPVPDRVRALVAEGRLGKKSGAGFYEY